MNIEDLREYCLAKPHTTEELPFDEDTLVFKVAGKMFVLCSMSEYQNGIALKCDPEEAVELKEKYHQVQPPYHMSKTHWISVLPEAGLSDLLLQQWIDNSYNLVVKGLTKKLQKELGFIPA
ncbi:MAG: MmcQ/YjbR family DNA-binding protein [Hymenobacteraceae bacterium]|nr:MmcQ/YjbR family DNA-binding protein [Hymenobacteraceae bacterium]MDX5397469.1 MmcQ/YjbR family DNA-binding protein [Hymenobacteraceae bacterium]MDX5443202.1 MmcQ/YjbR family DNA-binding protein [Hymenobacteraceae bacterium]MDX5513545.1 MmcQ/YjbR family DNA-binding protein [Hymenobacteraceae bacterium]